MEHAYLADALHKNIADAPTQRRRKHDQKCGERDTVTQRQAKSQ